MTAADQLTQAPGAQKATGPDAGPASDDRSQAFTFEHKVFSMAGGYFAYVKNTKEPAFHLPLGDLKGAIALPTLRMEFDLTPETNDGKLLDIVDKALRYVKEIRPNDSIPHELLDGTASWTVEEKHRTIARNRLTVQLVSWLTGGDTALTGLQNLITITALPFTVVLVLMAVALQRELANDPFAIRDRYQRAAVEKATVRGLVEYGDDFAFTVERTPPGSWYAAGEGFDSTAAEITDWYRRTDEDGNPVDYDYVLGEYLDEGDGDGADGPAGAGPSGR